MNDTNNWRLSSHCNGSFKHNKLLNQNQERNINHRLNERHKFKTGNKFKTRRTACQI